MVVITEARKIIVCVLPRLATIVDFVEIQVHHQEMLARQHQPSSDCPISLCPPAPLTYNYTIIMIIRIDCDLQNLYETILATMPHSLRPLNH